jgi:predicted dehydrogenase
VKIVLFGASHWHVPLYLDALERSGAHVVAVSDREGHRGADVARRFGCLCYASDEALLLAEHQFDFAFVFARHADLAALGAMLVDRRIPFAMEKPCGIDAAEVAELRARAEAAGLYVAVPFILREGDLLACIRQAEGEHSRLHHAAFRFIAGPLARYRETSAWMFDRAQAGGGCTINLGVHFIDLFVQLTGQPVAAVRAVMGNRSQGAGVEDHAVLLLTAADGTEGVVEVGYTFPGGAPEPREFAFTISSDAGYYRAAPGGVSFIRRAAPALGAGVLPASLDTDALYGDFVTRVLADVRTGAAPLAGLADAEAVMRVIDAAYASATADGARREVVTFAGGT